MLRVPAVVCIVAIILISLYSAFAVNRVIVSNAPPTVTFTLGTTYRDVTYGNSQTMDIYYPPAWQFPGLFLSQSTSTEAG